MLTPPQSSPKHKQFTAERLRNLEWCGSDPDRTDDIIYDHDPEDQSDNDVTIIEEQKYEESMREALLVAGLNTVRIHYEWVQEVQQIVMNLGP